MIALWQASIGVASMHRSVALGALALWLAPGLASAQVVVHQVSLGLSTR
jgi:hypothetical protein